MLPKTISLKPRRRKARPISVILAAVLVAGAALAVVLAGPLRATRGGPVTPAPESDGGQPQVTPLLATPSQATHTASPHTPTPVGAPSTPAPQPTIDQAQSAAVRSGYRQLLEAMVAQSPDPQARLVVRPLDCAGCTISVEGDDILHGASAVKSMFLVFAIFRDPGVGLQGWTAGTSREAYRMIVHSNNTASGQVLWDIGEKFGDENVLDSFNAFLHTILGLPGTVGVRVWEYGPTDGMVSTAVEAIPPDENPDGVFAHPLTLDALVDFYTLLETPSRVDRAIEQAIEQGYPPIPAYLTVGDYYNDVWAALNRAEALMAIPDPEYQTETERAIARATEQHPGVQIAFYGKNGHLAPYDWPGNRWHIVDGGVVTVGQGEAAQRCVIAYSASSFESRDVLDAALDYCIAIQALRRDALGLR